MPDRNHHMNQFDFKLKVYPNPMLGEGVFVAEDRPIEPYANVGGLRGPLYPAVPQKGFAIPYALPHDFADELVRRWNAGGRA